MFSISHPCLPQSSRGHSTSQMEARSQCLTFQLKIVHLENPHIMAQDFWGHMPPPSWVFRQGMAVSPCRDSGNALRTPQFVCGCKQTKGCLGERIPRGQTVTCLFSNLLNVCHSEDGCKRKEKSEQKILRPGLFLGQCVSKL